MLKKTKTEYFNSIDIENIRSSQIMGKILRI